MAITVYIDLSAKVEQWNRDSAIAMANDDHCRVILVSGSIKQRIKSLIIEQHGRKSVNYRLMAALIYLAVRDSLGTIECIVIDKDYGGAQVEATITNLLMAHIWRDKPHAKASMIRFENVKGSRADRLAKQVYDRKAKPDHEPKYGEIARLLRK